MSGSTARFSNSLNPQNHFVKSNRPYIVERKIITIGGILISINTFPGEGLEIGVQEVYEISNFRKEVSQITHN